MDKKKIALFGAAFLAVSFIGYDAFLKDYILTQPAPKLTAVAPAPLERLEEAVKPIKLPDAPPSDIARQVDKQRQNLSDLQFDLLVLTYQSNIEEMKSEIAGYKNAVDIKAEELRQIKNKPVDLPSTHASSFDQPSAFPSALPNMPYQEPFNSVNTDPIVKDESPEDTAVLHKLSKGVAIVSLAGMRHSVRKGSLIGKVKVLSVNDNHIQIQNTKTKKRRTLYFSAKNTRTLSRLEPIKVSENESE